MVSVCVWGGGGGGGGGGGRGKVEVGRDRREECEERRGKVEKWKKEKR